jgi:hypothetical protein
MDVPDPVTEGWIEEAIANLPDEALMEAISILRGRGGWQAETTLLLLGHTEVDHPRIDSVLVQERNRAGPRRDVVDLGGQHHRRHRTSSLSGGHRAGVRDPIGAGGRGLRPGRLVARSR